MFVIKPSTVVTRPPSVPAESSRSSSATATDAVSDCDNPPKPKVNHTSDKESLGRNTTLAALSYVLEFTEILTLGMQLNRQKTVCF